VVMGQETGSVSVGWITDKKVSRCKSDTRPE
jgi:hypothetical protein